MRPYFQFQSLKSTCVFQEDFVHVGAGVLKQLVLRVEDDNCYLTVTEDTQLVRLLHQAELPLGEGHLSVPLVGNPSDGDLLSTHLDSWQAQNQLMIDRQKVEADLLSSFASCAVYVCILSSFLDPLLIFNAL